MIFILASSTHASAVDIPIRIVNETGQDIMIRSVDPNDKRGRDARQGSCTEHRDSEEELEKNKNEESKKE